MVLSTLPDTHHRQVCSHLRGTAHQTIGTFCNNTCTHIASMSNAHMSKLATFNSKCLVFFRPYHVIAHRTPPVLATWESSEHKEFDISRVGQHLLEQSHSNNSFQFEALNQHDLKQQNKPIQHSLFPRPADLIVLCTWSHVQVSCFIFIQKAHLKTTISGLQLPSVVNPKCFYSSNML